jgi:hypothetical protein
MDLFTPSLDNDMQAELEALHQLIQRIADDGHHFALSRPMAPLTQADRILQRLADWMLDDEQKQVMGDHPLQPFFVHAAAYLYDIANRLINTLDSQGASLNTKNSFITHLATFFDFSEVDDAVYDGLSESLHSVVNKRFKDFVRVHFPHTRSAGGVAEADGYSERWQQRILDAFGSAHWVDPFEHVVAFSITFNSLHRGTHPSNRH